MSAWDAIHQYAVEQQGALEIIAIGPLTNLAKRLFKYSDLPQLIKRIVIMGGSTDAQVTPLRPPSFNIYADPEAADIVFARACPCTCAV